MLNRYKVILSNNALYKEVELAPESASVCVGTSTEADIRLHKQLFFEKVDIFFEQKGGEWSVTCSDNLYLTVGDVRKLLTKKLRHGDVLHIKYQGSDNDVMTLSFMIDFEYEYRDYNIAIDLRGKTRIKIGGSHDSDILLSDEHIGSDSIMLDISGNVCTVYDNRTAYGVYVNGIRIQNSKQLKNSDFFSIAGFGFYLRDGILYTSNARGLSVRGLPAGYVNEQSTHFKYPEFVRSARVQYQLPDEEIEVQQPVPKPQKPRKNLLLSLIPSIFMLVLMVVLRGIIGGGGMFVFYSVGSMGIGIIMSIITYRMDGKDYKESWAKREAEYGEYINGKEAEIVAAREDELRIRNLIYTSVDDSIEEVRLFGKRIFERTAEDKDFLDIYLGKGLVEAGVPVKYQNQEFIDTEDPITLLPKQLEEKYHYIDNAPIVSHFNSSCGVGIVGSRQQLHTFLRNISIDLAARHFYKEVKMYYVVTEEEADSIGWLRWLRHLHNDELDVRNILCDDESRKVLLENLYSVLSSREAEKKEKDSVTFEPRYIVFVLDGGSIRNHPISKYIANCSEYGFTFVFFEEYEEYLPVGCNELIRLSDSSYSGSLINCQNGDKVFDFNYAPIAAETAERTALRLGAASVEEVSLESELTKNITLFRLLNILSVDDLDLGKRWGASQVYKSMSAPLGVKTKNEIVSLDISDKSKAHGPHGLVAGTTGSGKSEILQTYVLSMASLFHPYDVGFVIIDFKGGGMANQFKDLPHMMGAITNIDGREINRSLLSIKAELVKRQSLFAEAGVNHINDYIKLYKSGTVKQPLPHMIIIVDEFAELKAEFPDFMKELISAARIGRTLGVHLILATQKPAGVVDAQIWSNSKFKLCLKVQTKEDSNEVIKTPLAAEIVEPGRAYFQVGNNEIFELFQSAYSGAKVTDSSEAKEQTFSIYEINRWGKKKEVFTNKKNSSNESAPNQLQAIVSHIDNYCKANHIAKLSGICLPSLADIIHRRELGVFDRRKAQGIIVPVGYYDDPERQEQGNYYIDLSSDNTYVIGSAMTGKTTLLQTILLQLMDNYTPKDVNVYIIDCGNMTLKVFEGSNIVGGVALTSEEEKVNNLFKMLFRMIETRKHVFSEKGIGTHHAYVEAGFTDMPQVVVMIDNLSAFREYYDNLSDAFLSLSREGNSVGISFVATGSQTNAMNYKALANYGARIAYICNDSGEYTNLFDRCRIEPKDTPGRGLCVIDKRILEFQTALCVEGAKEIDRVNNIKAEIARCNSNYSGIKAKEIPVVPEVIKLSDIKRMAELHKQPYCIPVGMDFTSVEYAMLELGRISSFGIIGKNKSYRVNLVRCIMENIMYKVFDDMASVFVYDDPSGTLKFCEDYGFVQEYQLDETCIEDIIGAMHEELLERAKAQASGGAGQAPLMLLVIENRKVIEFVSKNQPLMQKLKEIIETGEGLRIVVALTNIEDATVGFSSPELYKVVKNNKKIFVFGDLAEVKFVDVSVKQQKEHSKQLKEGDMFMCFDGGIRRIRTITSD